MNRNSQIGQLGENIACKKYIASGYKILSKNFYNLKGKRLGEIDFIAIKKNHLRFVEVKTRTGSQFGDPVEAITKFKIKRIFRIIEYFLFRFEKYRSFICHIDVVTVQINRVDNSIGKIRIYSDVIVGYS